MIYFTNITTLEELKKEYRKLAMKYHPDVSKIGNATEHMKQINKQYDDLFEQLKQGNKHTENEHVSTYKDIINNLIKYNDLTIDIVGSWLWVHGKGTYAAKDALKEYGFRWSKSKKKWYYFNGIKDSKRMRGRKSYDQIVAMHGKQTIITDNKPKLITI